MIERKCGQVPDMADKVVAKSAARDEIADAQRGERFKISKAHARAKEGNISGYISAQRRVRAHDRYALFDDPLAQPPRPGFGFCLRRVCPIGFRMRHCCHVGVPLYGKGVSCRVTLAIAMRPIDGIHRYMADFLRRPRQEVILTVAASRVVSCRALGTSSPTRYQRRRLTRALSLPQAQPAADGSASPWGRPELF